MSIDFDKIKIIGLFDSSFSGKRRIGNDLYCGEEMPEKKIEKALGNYAKNKPLNEIALILYDSTILGGGSDGFMVTSRALYATVYPLSDHIRLCLFEIFSVVKYKSILIFNGQYVLSISALTDEFQVCLYDFFLELVSLYGTQKKSDIDAQDVVNINEGSMLANLDSNIEKDMLEPLWTRSEFKVAEKFTKFLALNYKKQKIDGSLFLSGIFISSLYKQLDCLQVFSNHHMSMMVLMRSLGISLDNLVSIDIDSINEIVQSRSKEKIVLHGDLKSILVEYKSSDFNLYVSNLIELYLEQGSSKVTQEFIVSDVACDMTSIGIKDRLFVKKWAITEQLIKWLDAKGWKERPVFNDDQVNSTTSFRYAASGEYGLNCLITVSEDTGMISLSAWPDFGIEQSKIEEVRKLCGHFRKEFGNFYVSDDGRLIYIHSRSIDSFERGLDDVSTEVEHIMEEMDNYISFLALSIVDVSNGNLSALDAIQRLG